MFWNINGKWTDPQTHNHIQVLMYSLKLDALCFSESHIILEDIPALKRSFGDKPVFISCENTRVHGAGIVLYERYNGCVLRWEASRIPDRAAMGLVRTHSRITMIISVYLPSCPLESNSEAISQEVELDLNNWIDLTNNQHYDIIIGGDFNVNLLDTTKARAQCLGSLFQNLHICLDDTVPTHDKNGALDNIVISTLGIQEVLAQIETRFLPLESDHCPLVLQYTISDRIIGDAISYYEYETVT
jgi:exonuclease III